MRKRAQRKSKPILDESKHVSMKTRITKEEKSYRFDFKKNWWIAVSLLGIFLLILFFNSYYNASTEISINPEGEGFDKFYLSGPDPYYNMRLVEQTHNTGRYPYYSEDDPLLNYPLGRSGARAPLFNMMALGFSRVLTPFMNEIDAIGYSMQFIPALFGALLIFPVYFIGKEIFNRKAGLIGALFVALIPIHLGSGHGSAYSLFDHDSFNLLLFFMTFLFLIKSLKEKDPTKSLLYAILGGVPLAALSMTWVKAQYLYVIIAIYAFVQMFIDIFKNKIDFSVFRTTSVVLFTGYLVSLPVLIVGWGGYSADVNLFLCLGVAIFGLIYYIFGKSKIPWTLSMPAVFCAGVVGLIILHPSVLQVISTKLSFLGRLGDISEILYGSGIYGSKVSMTIAEANTYQISHSVMSFGPTMYWLGWTGFLFLIFYFYKNKNPPGRDYLFIIVLFLVSVWLTSIAGRFINDMVPVIAMLAGWIVWMLLEWIDYPQMIRNIRSAGGGFHGLRRGIKFLHVFGILFVAFLVLLPNAFIAFDAAIPVNAPTQDGESDLKTDMFGEEHAGAFGLGIGKERYWADAFKWLSEQDQDIKNHADRPAFISWWDYGFYEVAMGEHPTVADNFQDGIPAAGNFHTATSEKEAVGVLIVRLLEGDVKKNDGAVSDKVKSVLTDNLRDGNNTDNVSKIISWIEDPMSSPSYSEPIEPQYHKYIREEINTQFLTVGSQWRENAAYHDIVEFLINETHGLSDEEITWLYHDIQEATGWSVRYYGVEGYDKQIFNIFAFLSDKSLLMVGAPQDDFVEVIYTGYILTNPNDPNSERISKTWPAQEIYEMSDEDKKYIVVEDQNQRFYDLYFDTMFYKTYFGPKESEQQFKVQIPCTGMRHFYAEYMSDLSKPFSQYYSGIGAVVIAKYYEGAVVNGTLLFNNSGTMEPLDAQVVITKDVAYTSETSYFIDHDKMNTTNGTFGLIAGAGAVLQIRRYLELDSGIPWYGGKSFVMKEITLNVSDADAMRKTDNWQRALGNITVDPANISGYIFDNMDNNDTYNASVDKPLSNVTVILQGISKMELTYDAAGNTQLVPVERDLTMIKTNTTNEMGYYGVSGLKPGYYILEIRIDSIPIIRTLIPLSAGDISVNISKPKPATVEGIVYYDQNQNNEYDSGEEEGDVNVSIYYQEENPPGSGNYEVMLVNSTTTSSTGSYKFESLIPGRIKGVDINEYVIQVLKLPMYQSEVIIKPDENMTTSLNISVDLAPVNVAGFTKYNDQGIGDIEVVFTKDDSEAENTAIFSSTISNETTGYYQVDLVPGSYNISVERKEGEIIVYSYSGKLKLDIGEGSRSDVDIILVKESVNISGLITDEDTGTIAEGVSIEFTPDGSIENNTVITPSIPVSNDAGFYTVELTPGSYNITASKNDDMGTLVYYSESKLSVDLGDDGRSVDILVDKKSVTVSGTTSYYNTNKENITMFFEKDESVENNDASPTAVKSDNTGFTLELAPGSYNITASSDAFDVDGVNYTYVISEDTNKLTVKETDIAAGVTFSIKLEMTRQ